MMQPTHIHSALDASSFPREVAGLPEAASAPTIELGDGDVFDLEIAPVWKRIGDATVRMLAYNGSVPGPTLRIRQGSTVTVRVTNRGDHETTVHRHGLRLDNRYDGTHDTQALMPVGGSFTYQLKVPDAGVYWYHPHVREDYGQELGLYGNIIVVPAEAGYWPAAHREIALTLDDIQLEDGWIAGFDRASPTHVAMGRFGNKMLVAGDTDLRLDARRGEVVRLYLTNTANTRVFNVRLPGARMKLVGADSGRYERETFADEILLAPSERVVVDVLFERAGELALEHRTPERVYRLARVTVSDTVAQPGLAERFAELRTDAELIAERARIARYVDAAPDKALRFDAEMVLGGDAGATTYTCPMHPDVVSHEPGKCPLCRMKLVPAAAVSHGQHGHGYDGHGAHVTHAMTPARDLEWEDDMVEINRATTPANMRWRIVDVATGAANAAIDWRIRVGDVVKIRLVNSLDSDHPMPHPFHVHGAGRFLIVSRNGVVEPNLAWKDTVLVRTGETVDILLQVTEPGAWMAHCHIAEHHEGGMMFGFTVDP